jgi:Zn-dependent alcohol dehydrogenase
MLNILDAYEIQTIELGEIKFPANKETKLKFQITQVCKGDKYKNTAISLLMFEGIGGHEKTIVNPQKNLESKPNKS